MSKTNYCVIIDLVDFSNSYWHAECVLIFNVFDGLRDKMTASSVYIDTVFRLKEKDDEQNTFSFG